MAIKTHSEESASTVGRKRARGHFAFDPSALDHLGQYVLEIPQNVAFDQIRDFCKRNIPDPEALQDEVLAL